MQWKTQLLWVALVLGLVFWGLWLSLVFVVIHAKLGLIAMLFIKNYAFQIQTMETTWGRRQKIKVKINPSGIFDSLSGNKKGVRLALLFLF